MSIEVPAAFGADTAKTLPDAQPMTTAWLETALTALFAVATVLFVSFHRGHIWPRLARPSIRL